MRWGAKHRVYLSVAILAMYVLSFNYYILKMTSGIPEHTYKLMYNYITFSAIILYVSDNKLGIVNFIHEQFNFLLILCVIINYVLIILTHHCLIDGNWKQMFWSFNGAIFVVTMLILYSIKRHNVLNDE